jgi:hypothetical protein
MRLAGVSNKEDRLPARRNRPGDRNDQVEMMRLLCQVGGAAAAGHGETKDMHRPRIQDSVTGCCHLRRHGPIADLGRVRNAGSTDQAKMAAGQHVAAGKVDSRRLAQDKAGMCQPLRMLAAMVGMWKWQQERRKVAFGRQEGVLNPEIDIVHRVRYLHDPASAGQAKPFRPVGSSVDCSSFAQQQQRAAGRQRCGQRSKGTAFQIRSR